MQSTAPNTTKPAHVNWNSYKIYLYCYMSCTWRNVILFHGFDPFAQRNICKFFLINNKHIKCNEARMVTYKKTAIFLLNNNTNIIFVIKSILKVVISFCNSSISSSNNIFLPLHLQLHVDFFMYIMHKIFFTWQINAKLMIHDSGFQNNFVLTIFICS